jgi:hypothetical protein
MSQSTKNISFTHKLKGCNFNDCARLVMECLGESDYDAMFFAGLTGDVFAQIFSYDRFRGDGASNYLQSGDHSFFVNIFNACGYEAEFVSDTALRANPEPNLQKLISYIDRGIPVIRYWCGRWFGVWHVFVGYEDGGNTLLCMGNDQEEPHRLTARELFEGGEDWKDNFDATGWIFVGEKREQKDLKQLYRNAITDLPRLLATKTEGYCFGAEAFRAWADEIESGKKFDGMKPEDFKDWWMYSVYVCALATNSGSAQIFMRRAMKLNPDLAFLEDVCHQYWITGMLCGACHASWHRDCPIVRGEPCRREQGCRVCTQSAPGLAEYKKKYRGLKDLKALGGEFNIKLKTLQNPRKRTKIAAVIRECARCIDEVERLFSASDE